MILERTEAEECHRILSDAAVPGHGAWSLADRIRWLVDQDSRKLEMVVESTIQRQHLRDRLAMLEAEMGAN